MTYISISISSSSFSDSSMVCQSGPFDWLIDHTDGGLNPSDSSIVCQLGRFDWLVDHTDDGLNPSDSSMVCQLG